MQQLDQIYFSSILVVGLFSIKRFALLHRLVVPDWDSRRPYGLVGIEISRLCIPHRPLIQDQDRKKQSCNATLHRILI